MFDSTIEVAALVDRMTSATRAENRAAGARLLAISELDLVRLRECGEQASWASDTEAEITAEIGAALQISRNWASSYLYYARAMRLRLPKVGGLLCAGDISYATFQSIVYRTDLITDPEILAAVDTSLAGRVARWPAMTRSRLAGYVDTLVARADADAVRQRHKRHQDREITIWGDVDGVTEIGGRLFTTVPRKREVPPAHAIDARLDALAGTVCAEDPRTRAQRRADGLGALAAGADRLACRCGSTDCPAGQTPPPSPVLIHVVAEQATLDGTGSTPGSLIGADALIPPELLVELADYALRRSLIHPGDTAPEPGYLPSSRLADFVRCRDLTCRFPGCDQPAIHCDLDHTIAHADGGATHASNLKALCRAHHLLKTFWGWQDKQLADGTLIWTAPTGHTYVTTPGSALLFPALAIPTGDLTPPETTPEPPTDRCADRTAVMPQRRRTRAQNRARYIASERRRNQQVRQAHQAARQAFWTTPAPSANSDDDDPPPF